MPKAPPPHARFLLRHPAHLIACGFGSGLSRFAPGTAGTLFAWAVYPLLRLWMPDDVVFGSFLVMAFLLGIPACHITGRALGVVDHGSIVWDEVVPFWMVLWLAPATLIWQTLAFFAFRFYDIVKPPPANFFDEKVKNGFGVMMDDLIAAGYTVVSLAILKAAADALF
jgi:phosphatidylglycerophosphatase A